MELQPAGNLIQKTPLAASGLLGTVGDEDSGIYSLSVDTLGQSLDYSLLVARGGAILPLAMSVPPMNTLLAPSLSKASYTLPGDAELLSLRASQAFLPVKYSSSASVAATVGPDTKIVTSKYADRFDPVYGSRPAQNEEDLLIHDMALFAVTNELAKTRLLSMVRSSR